MKKLITLTTILLFGLNAVVQAQFILGGNIGFSSTKEKEEFAGDSEESTLTNIAVIPRLGFAFGDNWAGLDVGINSIKSERPDGTGGTTESKLNLFTISPFFRYMKKPADNMGIWIEAQAGGAFGKDQFEGDDQNKYVIINVGVRPGVIFFIGDHLSFEASFGRLGFTQATVTDANNTDDKVTTSNFGLSLNNNSVSVGFLGDELMLTPGFLLGVNWSFGGGGAEN